MKKFFNKQITERPRAGGGIKTPKGEKRKLQKVGDEGPKSEKIRQKWQSHYAGKEFTDVLGPLYRYFHSEVGNKWDDIYSDICKNLPKKSLQGLHIHGHIEQMVEKNVIIINGVPCHGKGYSYGSPLYGYGRYRQFYVNPETGTLCLLKPEPSKKKDKNPDLVIKDETTQYQRIKDIWYEIKVQEPKIVKKYEYPCFRNNRVSFVSKTEEYYDPLTKKYYQSYALIKMYGRFVVAVSKRQINSREIKKLVA